MGGNFQEVDCKSKDVIYLPDKQNMFIAICLPNWSYP